MNRAFAGWYWHIWRMRRSSYRIVPVEGTMYGVQVEEPNAAPHTVTGFRCIAEAEHWIEIKWRESGLDRPGANRESN